MRRKTFVAEDIVPSNIDLAEQRDGVLGIVVTAVNGPALCRLDGGKPDGCVSGTVSGTYLHGLFDTGEAVKALAKALCQNGYASLWN